MSFMDRFRRHRVEAAASAPRPPWDGGWRAVPAPDSVLQRDITVGGGQRFRAGLASWQDHRFGMPLGHLVSSDAPAGVIRGVVVPGSAVHAGPTTLMVRRSQVGEQGPTSRHALSSGSGPAGEKAVIEQAPEAGQGPMTAPERRLKRRRAQESWPPAEPTVGVPSPPSTDETVSRTARSGQLPSRERHTGVRPEQSARDIGHAEDVPFAAQRRPADNYLLSSPGRATDPTQVSRSMIDPPAAATASTPVEVGSKPQRGPATGSLLGQGSAAEPSADVAASRSGDEVRPPTTRSGLLPGRERRTGVTHRPERTVHDTGHPTTVPLTTPTPDKSGRSATGGRVPLSTSSGHDTGPVPVSRSVADPRRAATMSTPATESGADSPSRVGPTSGPVAGAPALRPGTSAAAAEGSVSRSVTESGPSSMSRSAAGLAPGSAVSMPVIETSPVVDSVAETGPSVPVVPPVPVSRSTAKPAAVGPRSAVESARVPDEPPPIPVAGARPRRSTRAVEAAPDSMPRSAVHPVSRASVRTTMPLSARGPVEPIRRDGGTAPVQRRSVSYPSARVVPALGEPLARMPSSAIVSRDSAPRAVPEKSRRQSVTGIGAPLPAMPGTAVPVGAARPRPTHRATDPGPVRRAPRATEAPHVQRHAQPQVQQSAAVTSAMPLLGARPLPMAGIVGRQPVQPARTVVLPCWRKGAATEPRPVVPATLPRPTGGGNPISPPPRTTPARVRQPPAPRPQVQRSPTTTTPRPPAQDRPRQKPPLEKPGVDRPQETGGDLDLDDLARRLLEPVGRLLRTELRHGRERAGRLYDRRR